MPQPSIHPQFQSKVVCNLSCSHCSSKICDRGMKAMLLGDTRVELYSTDIPPYKVELVENDYMTRNCTCRIRDVACLGCGNVIGYHVTQPCERCLRSCNNGHFWMFLANDVVSTELVLDGRTALILGIKKMLWVHLISRQENDLNTCAAELSNSR